LGFRRRWIPLEFSNASTKGKGFLIYFGIFNRASTLDRRYFRCIGCAEDPGCSLQIDDGSSASRYARSRPPNPALHCNIFRWSLQWLPALPGFRPSSRLSARRPLLSAQCPPKHRNGSSCPHLLPPLSPINNPAKAAAPASHLRRLMPGLLPPFLDRHSRARQPAVPLNFGSQHQPTRPPPRSHPHSRHSSKEPSTKHQAPPLHLAAGPPRQIVRLPSSLAATDRPRRVHHCRPNKQLQQPNPDRRAAERRPLVGGRLHRRNVF
jgi:hypothetical protein